MLTSICPVRCHGDLRWAVSIIATVWSIWKRLGKTGQLLLPYGRQRDVAQCLVPKLAPSGTVFGSSACLRSALDAHGERVDLPLWARPVAPEPRRRTGAYAPRSSDSRRRSAGASASDSTSSAPPTSAREWTNSPRRTASYKTTSPKPWPGRGADGQARRSRGRSGQRTDQPATNDPVAESEQRAIASRLAPIPTERMSQGQLLDHSTMASLWCGRSD